MWPVNEIIDSNDGRSSSYVHRMSNLDGGAFVHRYIEPRRLYRLRLVCVRRGERERSSISRACLLNFQSDAGSGMATIKHRFPAETSQPKERPFCGNGVFLGAGLKREVCVGVGEKHGECEVLTSELGLEEQEVLCRWVLLVGETAGGDHVPFPSSTRLPLRRLGLNHTNWVARWIFKRLKNQNGSVVISISACIKTRVIMRSIDSDNMQNKACVCV